MPNFKSAFEKNNGKELNSFEDKNLHKSLKIIQLLKYLLPIETVFLLISLLITYSDRISMKSIESVMSENNPSDRIVAHLLENYSDEQILDLFRETCIMFFNSRSMSVFAAPYSGINFRFDRERRHEYRRLGLVNDLSDDLYNYFLQASTVGEKMSLNCIVSTLYLRYPEVHLESLRISQASLEDQELLVLEVTALLRRLYQAAEISNPDQYLPRSVLLVTTLVNENGMHFETYASINYWGYTQRIVIDSSLLTESIRDLLIGSMDIPGADSNLS